jgi:hypothetical protein
MLLPQSLGHEFVVKLNVELTAKGSATHAELLFFGRTRSLLDAAVPRREWEEDPKMAVGFESGRQINGANRSGS